MPAIQTNRHHATGARRFLKVSNEAAKIRAVSESQADPARPGHPERRFSAGAAVQGSSGTIEKAAVGSGSSSSAPSSSTPTDKPKRRRTRQPDRQSPRTIRRALAAAQHAGRAVAKRGFNDEGGWSYALAEDIVVEGNDILHAHHLSVIELDTRIERNEALGCPVLRTRWQLVYTPPDGDDETLDLGWREWPIVEERQRMFDRATGAASTSSLAYFLRGLLQLARVEDGTDSDDGLRDRSRIDEKPAGRPHFRRHGPGRGNPSGGVRADPLTRLVAAVSKHYDRLGIPIAKRDAHSERILERKPETVSDFQELATRLANMGLSSEQLGEAMG